MAQRDIKDLPTKPDELKAHLVDNMMATLAIRSAQARLAPNPPQTRDLLERALENEVVIMCTLKLILEMLDKPFEFPVPGNDDKGGGEVQ